VDRMASWRDAQDTEGWSGHPSSSLAWLSASASRSQRGAFLFAEHEGRLVTALQRASSGLWKTPGHGHGGYAAQSGSNLQMVSAALAEMSRSRLVVLSHAPVELVGAIATTNATMRWRTHDQALYVEAADAETYEGQLPRRLRATVRAGVAAARKSGAMTQVVEFHGFLRVLPSLRDVEFNGHRHRGRVFSGKPGRVVAAALAELDNDGLLRVWTMERKGAVIAYLVVLRSPRQDYFATMAMHADAAALSAGTTLFASAISDALRSGRSVNLGPGSTPFKTRFATKYERLADVVLLPGGVSGATSRLLRLLPATHTGGKWA